VALTLHVHTCHQSTGSHVQYIHYQYIYFINSVHATNFTKNVMCSTEETTCFGPYQPSSGGVSFLYITLNMLICNKVTQHIYDLNVLQIVKATSLLKII
jgi:hypothetical protein